MNKLRMELHLLVNRQGPITKQEIALLLIENPEAKDVAEVKAEALREAVTDFESNVGVAEFDEQTRRDGCHHTHAYEAWDHQSAYMDWLRNRADQIEGKDS